MIDAYYRARGLDIFVQERNPEVLPWP
jgi:hypothetical protein